MADFNDLCSQVQNIALRNANEAELSKLNESLEDIEFEIKFIREIHEQAQKKLHQAFQAIENKLNWTKQIVPYTVFSIIPISVIIYSSNTWKERLRLASLSGALYITLIFLYRQSLVSWYMVIKSVVYVQMYFNNLLNIKNTK